MIVPAITQNNTTKPDRSEIPEELRDKVQSITKVEDGYKVRFGKDYEIEQVRKEAKQRTEKVVGKIADIIESKDFQKQGIGKEIADEIRNSNAKK